MLLIITQKYSWMNSYKSLKYPRHLNRYKNTQKEVEHSANWLVSELNTTLSTVNWFKEMQL